MIITESIPTRKIITQPPVQPRKKWRARYVVYFLDFLSITAALTFGAFASTQYSTYRIDTQSTAQELATLAVITALWMGIIWLNQGYAFHSRVHSTIGIKSVVKSSLYLAGILALFDTIFTTPFIHPYLLVSIPVGIVLISIMRAVSALTVRRIKRHRPSRLLFVGKSSDILDVLGNNFNLRFPYHQIAAFLLTDPENKDALPQLEDCHFVSYLPDHDVAQTAKQLNCDAVWVASVTDFGNKNLRRLAWNLRSVKARLYLEPMIEGVAETRLHPMPIGPRTVLSVDRPRIRAANGWIKRAFDIVFSAAILVLISPIMLATALAIKLEDGGPVVYKSERIGKKGKPYKVWKFRSMCIDAEEKIQALIKETGGQSLLFKMKDDPRVTRVGKFIRKYSIDELPQFFNSLNGTMSVVGPRPQVQREVDEYDADMYMRLEVPPGITGLWQVSGRSNLSPQLAQALDLYYVDNWTFTLDMRIIFATLKAVLKSEGAY